MSNDVKSKIVQGALQFVLSQEKTDGNGSDFYRDDADAGGDDADAAGL